MTNDKKYICTKCLARVTGLSPSFFEKLRVQRAGPPYHKVGSRVLYSWSDVEAWFQSRRENPEGDGKDGGSTH